MRYRDPRNWYMDLANAEAYDQKTFAADVGEYRQQFLNRLPARLWPCEDATRKILDLGCGGGRDILAFMRDGQAVEVSGIEWSLPLADKARDRGCTVVCSELEYEIERLAAIEAWWFHGMWAMASLLWIKSERALTKLIDNIASILVDRGVLFISVPYSEETKVGHDRGKDISIYLYSYSTWRTVLEGAGFVIEHETKSRAESSDKEWLNLWAIRHEELD